MLRKVLSCCVLCCLASFSQNLLLNPSYEFHSFINHRDGKAVSYEGHSVAFWCHDAFGDITVQREAHVAADRRPRYSVGNIVSVAAGKSFGQVIALPEARLAHGDSVAFAVSGWQSQPKSATALVEILKLDSEDGEWSPKTFGYGDKRTFPKHSRGELCVAKAFTATADGQGFFTLAIPAVDIEGHFTNDGKSHSADVNAVAIRVTLKNGGAEGAQVNFWAPSLVRGKVPADGLVASERVMDPVFANIPKTMQKLWKGESIHIILMGSSIDRGSANPPMYLYDENPASPTYKQPLSERVFDAEKIGHPEYDGYFGWWQHYFSYGGRLRLELMRKFNLPVSKVCLNMMACDGSCVGEATSCLESYCSLTQPCEPGLNGQKGGCTWQALYPELFTRPQGPAPDLVIFGSGANEKTDTPDEGAVFEASIRWIQARYPDTEFLFCVFQNRGGYTPNPGDLQAIALRYQIPFMDYGKLGDDLTRWCTNNSLVPRDGHPQAAGHYFWYHTLAKAFECWDPIPAGKAQLHLPSRLYDTTIGWEGHVTTYDGKDARIVKGTKCILDDTTFNVWTANGKKSGEAYLDGKRLNGSVRERNATRNIRNSAFRYGRCNLGDRHVLELKGEDCTVTAIDMKTVNGRTFYPVTSSLWKTAGTASPFASAWGAPYGKDMVTLKAGETAEITVPATDVSIAYVDAADGGVLAVAIDGAARLSVPSNQPYKTLEGEALFMENRKGVRFMPYGMHRITVTAQDGPVRLLGVFAYDTRPNQERQRIATGIAVAGERVAFIPPFKATPVMTVSGAVVADAATADGVSFKGQGIGTYIAVGE